MSNDKRPGFAEAYAQLHDAASDSDRWQDVEFAIGLCPDPAAVRELMEAAKQNIRPCSYDAHCIMVERDPCCIECRLRAALAALEPTEDSEDDCCPETTDGIHTTGCGCDYTNPDD